MIASATMYVGATAAAGYVLYVFARGLRHRQPVSGLQARVAVAIAVFLLGLGAFVVVAMTFWTNADIDVGWAGIPGAVLLVALMLLVIEQPERAARYLRLGAAVLVPVLALVTVLTYVFERAEWQEASIGPFVGGVLFFAIPAWIVARVTRIAARH